MSEYDRLSIVHNLDAGTSWTCGIPIIAGASSATTGRQRSNGGGVFSSGGALVGLRDPELGDCDWQYKTRQSPWKLHRQRAQCQYDTQMHDDSFQIESLILSTTSGIDA